MGHGKNECGIRTLHGQIASVNEIFGGTIQVVEPIKCVALDWMTRGEAKVFPHWRGRAPLLPHKRFASLRRCLQRNLLFPRRAKSTNQFHSAGSIVLYS